jgi:hypothetical protein
MLTRYETRKLQAEMRRELEEPTYTLWKCAAGLLFVTALVLVGAGSATAPDAPAYASTQAAGR